MRGAVIAGRPEYRFVGRRRSVVALAVAVAQFAAFSCCRQTVADNIQAAGDVLLGALPLAAGALTLAHRDGEGAVQLGESLAVTFGLTYALKYSINEKRPYGAYGEYNGGQSFPSGHASITFSAAEFMRIRYGWEYGVPAYVAATFVAYSRVESDQHHPQDVVAGAGIGFLTSYILTESYRGWKVRLGGDAESVSVRLTRRF